MRLKSIIAPTMAEAMRQVRSQCGEEAVIVSTRETKGEVLLMVAVPRDEPPAPAVPLPAVVDENDPVDTIADSLAWHGVPNALIGRITQAAEDSSCTDATGMLAAALPRVLRFGRLPRNGNTPPLLLAGPPGAGKSVSIAKLAIRAARDGLRPAVVTLDGDRAGALAQLGTFCAAIGVDLQQADGDAGLRDSLIAANGCAPILIDTPGCDPYAPADIVGLARRAAAASAMPVLTLPCGMDPAEAADIAAIFREAGAAHLIATRLDIARRLGGLLAAAAGGLALVEAGASRRVADPLAPLDPLSLARRLLAGGRPSHATASERAIA